MGHRGDVTGADRACLKSFASLVGRGAAALGMRATESAALALQSASATCWCAMGYPAVMAALGVRAVLMGPEGHNVRGDARDCCAELGKRLRVEPVVMGELGSGEVVGARRWRRGRWEPCDCDAACRTWERRERWKCNGPRCLGRMQ